MKKVATTILFLLVIAGMAAFAKPELFSFITKAIGQEAPACETWAVSKNDIAQYAKERGSKAGAFLLNPAEFDAVMIAAGGAPLEGDVSAGHFIITDDPETTVVVVYGEDGCATKAFTVSTLEVLELLAKAFGDKQPAFTPIAFTRGA